MKMKIEIKSKNEFFGKKVKVNIYLFTKFINKLILK